MKKFILVNAALILICQFVWAAPRTWVLKTGETVTGDFISSGTTTLVVKTGGTNCFLKIADLSTNDQAYIAKIKADQKQARLDAETNQMAQAGWIELTSQLLENFPEKTDLKTGWMDCKFNELTSSYSKYPELYLGFSVFDKNGDTLFKCIVQKYVNGNPNSDPNPLVPEITNLKRGDKIRLIGRRSYLSLNDSFNNEWIFSIDKVEIIETAAEKKAREQQDITAP
jgi:hypothetical protein